METKFQTSFIPKKPLTAASPSPSVDNNSTSVLLLVGILIFVVSVLAAGGAYGWQVYLNSQKEQYKSDLAKLQNSVDITNIRKYKQMATKIDLASTTLSKHVALSQVFSALSKLAVGNIRFTNMDLQVPTDGKTDQAKINLTGYAPSYEALAFQSDMLGHLEELNLRDIVMNPIIQDPVQNQNSNISFTLSANLSPDSMSYKHSILSPDSTVLPVPANTSSSTNR